VLAMVEEEYYTPEQVAQMLQLKPGSVTKLLRQGKLPGYKVAGVWRINKEEFARYLKAQRNAFRASGAEE
jgi:excisionase family DNA binding protein